MQLFPEDSGKRRCCKLFFEMAVIAECLPLNDTVWNAKTFQKKYVQVVNSGEEKDR